MTKLQASGGYDDGYRQCPCFWGTKPGSLLGRLRHYRPDLSGTMILDAGCGEGKNAIFLAKAGAKVLAVDISPHALANARVAGRGVDNIVWSEANVADMDFAFSRFDVVVMYGLLHCLHDEIVVAQTVARIQAATTGSGVHVVCAFNSRSQDLERAHPNFRPFLGSHEFYLSLYRRWTVLEESDEDLVEVHPHNGIQHTHSMTRFIARAQ